MEHYLFHPAVLDAIFHVFKAANAKPEGEPDDELFLPNFIERIQMYSSRLPQKMWCYGKKRFRDEHTEIGDLVIYDETGSLVAEVKGFQLEIADHIRRPLGRQHDDWNGGTAGGRQAAGRASADNLPVTAGRCELRIVNFIK